MIDSCTHAIIAMISSLQSETHQTKNRNILLRISISGSYGVTVKNGVDLKN